MGPAGAGKTTLGRAVSAYLGAAFVDADDHHSHEAKEKMRAGIALDDVDRAPWLARLRVLIDEHPSEDGPLILACSALKRQYRVALGLGDPTVRFVHVSVPRPVLEERLRLRVEHFANSRILDSQLATLEPPDFGEALIVDGTRSTEELARVIAQDLSAMPHATGRLDKIVT